MGNKMRKWLMGFAIGILFHWLIAFLISIYGKEEILVLALSRNFQYVYLLVTTLLWGILGGAIFSLWACSREMKEKGLKRRYFASLGFLIGTLGAAFFLLLFIILPEPPPLGFIFLIPLLVFLFFLGALQTLGFLLGFFPSRNFLTRGFFTIREFQEVSLLVMSC